MQLPDTQKKAEILQLPSTWSDVDFSKLNNSERLFWFQERRIHAWLITDTRNIKYKADSMIGLAAMVSIGVEALSQFRYGKTNDSDKYFTKFLEDYIHSDFRTEVISPIPKDNGNKTTYSKIFYFGIRNRLMHSFLFDHAVLIEPQKEFLVWEKEKNRLLIDARKLLIYFEDGVRKYIQEIWEAESSSDIYKNFFKIFESNYKIAKTGTT